MRCREIGCSVQYFGAADLSDTPLTKGRTMHSRRHFLWLATMGVPGCAALTGVLDAFAADKKDDGVRLGVQTYSFREMLGKPGDMTEKMIAAMRQLGITECETWEPSLWPANL